MISKTRGTRLAQSWGKSDPAPQPMPTVNLGSLVPPPLYVPNRASPVDFKPPEVGRITPATPYQIKPPEGPQAPPVAPLPTSDQEMRLPAPQVSPNLTLTNMEAPAPFSAPSGQGLFEQMAGMDTPVPSSGNQEMVSLLQQLLASVNSEDISGRETRGPTQFGG